jgi:lipopolysaccharide/colanic/teichoic acid biosynthesis glycosyltransferase
METKNDTRLALFLWNAGGLFLVLLLGSKISWGTWSFLFPPGAQVFPKDAYLFLAVLLVFYALPSFLVWKYLRYPRVGRFSCLFLCSVSAWIAAVFLIAMFRLYYSRPFLLLACCIQMAWSFAGYRLFLDPSRLRFALIPGGMAPVLSEIPLCRWEVLKTPRLPEISVDGLVVDLHRDDLPQEWIRFIADCSLKGVPLFHAAALYENLTGRVSLEHIDKDLLREISAPRFHTFCKRPFDLAVVGFSIPVVLPLFCIVALAVRLSSGSPVFFRQERIGRFGRPFSILKFRSLETDGEGSMRPTRIGRFLRRHRLDELPQLLNVLRGEMSLVGPRPEQTALVSKYESSIPFYAFRAALRPGITGWAQVCWRYAGDTGDNRIKLEYDIFYMKRFSFWLDLLILAKTFGTVFSGEGSGENGA